jgi:hypothetical protein
MGFGIPNERNGRPKNRVRCPTTESSKAAKMSQRDFSLGESK